VPDLHLPGVSYVDQALTISAPTQDPTIGECWTRIVIDESYKTRLLNHALLAISLRRKGIGTNVIPLHGLVLLSGHPGVGKTSLARGISAAIAEEFGDRYGFIRLVEVNLHLLPSELLGRTQRNIIQLFEEELPVIAESGPIVVVLDEVEVLAVSRSQASLDINPADVFRGTAALLSALDWISANLPNAFVVGTTNMPGMVDDAVLSRCDLVMELPMPSTDVIRDILADTLHEMAKHYPGLESLSTASELTEIAKLLDGSDGRQARKFVADSLAWRRETSLDPSLLTIEQLLEHASSYLSGHD
jgi:pachytene checkpoint protein 2